MAGRSTTGDDNGLIEDIYTISLYSLSGLYPMWCCLDTKGLDARSKFEAGSPENTGVAG